MLKFGLFWTIVSQKYFLWKVFEIMVFPFYSVLIILQNFLINEN